MLDAVSLVLAVSSSKVVAEALKAASKVRGRKSKDIRRNTGEVQLAIDSSGFSAENLNRLLRVAGQTPSSVLSVSREMVHPSGSERSGSETGSTLMYIECSW